MTIDYDYSSCLSSLRKRCKTLFFASCLGGSTCKYCMYERNCDNDGI